MIETADTASAERQDIDTIIAEAARRLDQLEDRRKASRSEQGRRALIALAPAIDAALAKGYTVRQALETTRITKSLGLAMRTLLSIYYEIKPAPSKRAPRGKSQGAGGRKTGTTRSASAGQDGRNGPTVKTAIDQPAGS